LKTFFPDAAALRELWNGMTSVKNRVMSVLFCDIGGELEKGL
jgi:hypothetical protein